jgi:hypothetical protein
MSKLFSVLKWFLPKKWLDLINGNKTYIGLAGVLICAVLQLLDIKIPDNVMELFAVIAGAGYAHKAEKVKGDVAALKAKIQESVTEINKDIDEEVK